MNSNLDSLAHEMWEVAKEKPLDTGLTLKQNLPPIYRKETQVDGVSITVTFLLTYYGTRKIWQLFLYNPNIREVKGEVISKVVNTFYKQMECYEIPSKHYVGTMRQFVSFAEEDNNE